MSTGTVTASKKSSVTGILILECLNKTDPGSEGRFLSHMFNLMDVRSQYAEIRTKQQFIAMLGANPYDVVHITTHGYVPQKEFGGFWTPKGTVRLTDFPPGILQGKTAISTACKSGMQKFSKEFIKLVSPDYYVAPEGSPKFHNAIYFAHWFYHNWFVLGRSPLEAVEKYRDGYKNPHDFIILTGSKA